MLGVDGILPEWLQIMLYGEPGCGKTQLISTAPKPIYIMSFDPHGLQTIMPLISYLKMTNQPGIDYDDYYVGNLQTGALAAMGKVRNKLNALKRECPYATVAMDSLTFLSRLLKGCIISTCGRWGKEPEMREQDWGTLGSQSEEIVSKLMELKCNIIFTSHSTVKILDMPGDRKDVLYLSAVDGVKFPQKLPGYFDEVYRMVVKPKGQSAESNEYLCQTRSDYQWSAKSRLNWYNPEAKKLESILGMYEQADFTAMYDKLQKKRVELEKLVAKNG